MNIPEILPVIISTSVVVALISATFTKLSADKKIKIDNVTKERKEWRDRLRKLVVKTAIAFQKSDTKKLQKIEVELIVRLNPEDKCDMAIVESLKKLSRSLDEKDLIEFSDRVSYLLKHDWERVKKESETNISSQTLAIATFFATILFVPITYITGNYYFLYSCLSVLVFLSVPSLFNYFVNYRPNDNNDGGELKKLMIFTINGNPRIKYKTRDKRYNNANEANCIDLFFAPKIQIMRRSIEQVKRKIHHLKN